MVMRQPKTFFVLVGFACMLSMTGCGGSKPTTPPGNSQKATVQAAQPARAIPSASAKMICARETQKEIAETLGVHTTEPVVPTWINHLYSCRYTYHNSFMVLSVKELSNQTQTNAYFTSIAHRLGQSQRPSLLDRGAFFQEPLGRCPQGLQGPSRRHHRTARSFRCAARNPGGCRGQGRGDDHGLLDRRLITPRSSYACGPPFQPGIVAPGRTAQRYT